jgi:sugar phosphate isomerase/epimerase
MNTRHLSRRGFLALSAAAPLAPALAQRPRPPQRPAVAEEIIPKIPVGLELYSVRNELAKDLNGTVTAVAKMGYQVVEFYAPYFSWTTQQAKDVRKLLDGLGIRCNSTHNGPNAFAGDGIAKATELNRILGSEYIVMASAGRVNGLDGWRTVAETLTAAAEKFRVEGLKGGYHNHQLEFTPIDGKRPIEIIAAGTPKDFMLQLDVGTCVEMGSDPVAWIKQNPGRIRSLHLKEWGPGPDQGYKCLFGEGVAPWKEIFAAAESVGGVEYYLIEQEGSRFAPFETAQKCLASYKRIHL